jgi:C-terminal processing protease CtpA/Prc
MSHVLDLIKEAWQKGDHLTQKTSLSGETLLYPNRIRYTKPVLMLIDEMSGSGGDLFPALMQGYGRAKLLGTQTAGLGGHVESLPPLHFSQMYIQITKSLFYRPDGVPVENNGASPDYPYTPTTFDFLNEYKEYQSHYLNVLGEMINPQNPVP